MSDLTSAEWDAMHAWASKNGVCPNCFHTYPCHEQNGGSCPVLDDSAALTHSCPAVAALHFDVARRSRHRVQVVVRAGRALDDRFVAGTLTLPADQWDELRDLLACALDGRLTVHETS